MSKTIAGALVGQALGAFGRKPTVPELPTLDTDQVQRKAIEGNIAALPELEKLASSVNRFTYDQISQMLERTLPGFGSALSRAGESAGALVRGEVPEDVSRQVLRGGAARALGGGYGGSALGRNLTLRDLGLTSLEATGEGARRLTGLGSFARSTFPTFDYTTAFITPQQKLSFDWQQNLARFNRNLLYEQVEAAPDPNDVALAQALDNFFETWKNVGMGALGGVGGMGGMMGGGGGGSGGGGGGGYGGGGGAYGGWGSSSWMYPTGQFGGGTQSQTDLYFRQGWRAGGGGI